MMKRTVCFLFVLMVATNAFSQVANPTSPTRDYRKLAKSQTTSGAIFLVAGTVLCVVAVSSIKISFTQKADNSTFYTAGIAGLTSIVGSAILLKAGGRNRKKAKSMEVIQGQILLPNQGNLMTKAVPTVGLQLKF